MAEFPADFVADLRHLRPWPELGDSLWRSPVLAELTHGRLWRLVAEEPKIELSAESTENDRASVTALLDFARACFASLDR